MSLVLIEKNLDIGVNIPSVNLKLISATFSSTFIAKATARVRYVIYSHFDVVNKQDPYYNNKFLWNTNGNDLEYFITAESVRKRIA